MVLALVVTLNRENEHFLTLLHLFVLTLLAALDLRALSK